MALKSNEAKYQVALAKKHNWFPGTTIEFVELIIPKNAVPTLPYLEGRLEVKGKIVGVVLIEKGKSVKKTKKPAIKAADK